MSSPMSSTSVPSQNHSQSYLDPLGPEGFTGHISMHESCALHQSHQTPPVHYTQHLNQQVPAAEPPQTERQRVGEDVLVVQLERSLTGRGKPRLRWTQELHDRFVRAVSELGDVSSARPMAIQKRMNVEGLTTHQIKSHLQRYRANATKKSVDQGIQNSVNSHSPRPSAHGSSTSRSTAPVNGKALESFQAGTEEYGTLFQSSESPNYYQNLMFASMGDYQDNAMQTPNYFQDLLLAPMGDHGDNADNGSNFGL